MKTDWAQRRAPEPSDIASIYRTKNDVSINIIEVKNLLAESPAKEPGTAGD
jgi:hypothetical protein